MNTDDILNDDFLSDLIRKMPLESPSYGFVNKVMNGIEPLPAPINESYPSFIWVKSSIPYFVIGLAIALIMFSSDIPDFNFIYGTEYLSGMFIKVFHPLVAFLKTLLSSRFISYTLLIGVSAGFIFIVDKLFSRRFAA